MNLAWTTRSWWKKEYIYIIQCITEQAFVKTIRSWMFFIIQFQTLRPHWNRQKISVFFMWLFCLFCLAWLFFCTVGVKKRCFFICQFEWLIIFMFWVLFGWKLFCFFFFFDYTVKALQKSQVGGKSVLSTSYLSDRGDDDYESCEEETAVTSPPSKRKKVKAWNSWHNYPVFFCFFLLSFFEFFLKQFLKRGCLCHSLSNTGALSRRKIALFESFKVRFFFLGILVRILKWYKTEETSRKYRLA